MDQHSLHSSMTYSYGQSQLFSQYKDITARLKSRTRSLIPSKKINLQDVSHQFVSLGKQLGEYSKAYEGHCNLAAARTERLIPSLSNSTSSELQFLLEAARCFRDDAFDCFLEGKPFDSKKQDDIDAAVSCYRHALKISHESQVSCILYEMAKMHLDSGNHSEAARIFFEAGCYPEAASAFIQVNQFVSALNAYEKIVYKRLTIHDLITIYLLKLAANDIHVLRVVSDTRSDGQDGKSIGSHIPSSAAFSQLSLKSNRREGMRRLSSVNIPDFFVSLQFPVIPLIRPQDESTGDEYNSQDDHNKNIQSIASLNPAPQSFATSSLSGSDNRAKGNSVSATTSESVSTATPSSSSLTGYHCKGYRDMLLMNEDTLNLNILLESLYYFLKEFGSEIKLLVNSCSLHDKKHNKSYIQGMDSDTLQLEDEGEEVDEEDDLEDEEETSGIHDEFEEGSHHETSREKHKKLVMRHEDRQARDQLFDQLFQALRHTDHRKLVSFLLLPPSSSSFPSSSSPSSSSF